MQTPMTRIAGEADLIARAMPAMRPPPESGTTTVSRSGQSSSSSSPMVPWPAMTSGWSKGGTSTRPSSATSRSTSACASSWLVADTRTSAPSAWIAATLSAGTSRDRQTQAGTPSRAAA